MQNIRSDWFEQPLGGPERYALPQTFTVFRQESVPDNWALSPASGTRRSGQGINGVMLHFYRYAWAERARRCGIQNGSRGKFSDTIAKPSISLPTRAMRTWFCPR